MKSENLARGVAEQCSRHRRKGAHCLSEANLRAASVGEPRRAPEGPRHGNMVLGPFAPYKGFALRDEPNDGCTLRDAPRDSGAFQDAIGKSSAAGAKPGNTRTG